MRIIGVDPGQDKSGFVIYDTELEMVECAFHLENQVVLNALRGKDYRLSPRASLDEVAIEGIEPMGQVVGKSTFQTCVWCGRFQEAWEHWSGKKAEIVGRGDEKIVLCGTKTFVDLNTGKRKAITNSHIRQALLDKFPATGGGKRPQIGTKSKPGPLYGIKGDHCWSSLAVLVTALITKFPSEWRAHD